MLSDTLSKIHHRFYVPLIFYFFFIFVIIFLGEGDPHFVGFEGEKYDVMGENLKWFNLLTDKDTQANAFFEEVCLNPWTMMGEIAIRFKN